MSIYDGPGEGTWSVQCCILTEKLEKTQETVDRLEKELEIAKRFHEVAVKERDYERAMTSARPFGLCGGCYHAEPAHKGGLYCYVVSRHIKEHDFCCWWKTKSKS
jgi:hypothetical protein